MSGRSPLAGDLPLIESNGCPLAEQELVFCPHSNEQALDRLGLAWVCQSIPIAALTSRGHCLGRVQPHGGGYRHRARRQVERRKVWVLSNRNKTT